MVCRARVGSSADSGSSTRKPCASDTSARHAAALAFAAGQAVDAHTACPQVEFPQRFPRGARVDGREQRTHRRPQAPLRQAARQHGVDDALARRQGGVCGARNNARARRGVPAGQLPGRLPRMARCRTRGAARTPACAAGWSCRRRKGRSGRSARLGHVRSSSRRASAWPAAPAWWTLTL
jgi:hypothetical protein